MGKKDYTKIELTFEGLIKKIAKNTKPARKPKEKRKTTKA